MLDRADDTDLCDVGSLWILIRIDGMPPLSQQSADFSTQGNLKIQWKLRIMETSFSRWIKRDAIRQEEIQSTI
jgi:hypothetical protein